MAANPDYNALFKDKVLKNLLILIVLIVLGVLLTLTIVIVPKINKGEHVKIFGLEVNIPKEHPDTIVKTIKVQPDNPVPVIIKPLLRNVRPVVLPKTALISKLVNVRPPDTVKSNIKYNVTGAVNQSAIGDNAAVTNYNVDTKLPQRHFDNKSITQLMNFNPKHLPVEIIYFANNECHQLYSELNSELIKRGYKVQFKSTWNAMGNDVIQKEINNQATDSIFYVRIFKQD